MKRINRDITVNIRNQSGELLGTATSTKDTSDGIKKAVKIAKLRTQKQQEKIKSVVCNIVVTL